MTHARLVLMPIAEPEPAPEFTFKGPWFGYREACAYVGCKNMSSWYSWRNRHGIVARTNHTVAKADLDRVLTPRLRRRRRQSPAQLANLLHQPPRPR